jgi:hypothetical protein
MRGTMRAAIHRPIRFDPVTDDPAPAVQASGCQPRDRAFEAVKGVFVATFERNSEGLVVIVAASFALQG